MNILQLIRVFTFFFFTQRRARQRNQGSQEEEEDEKGHGRRARVADGMRTKAVNHPFFYFKIKNDQVKIPKKNWS